MSRQLLGIDIGTSACKVAVFDESGSVLAQSTQPYQVFYPEKGWAEQDPEEWWRAVLVGVKEVLSQKEVDRDEIAGIGVDGQSWSAIPMDETGEVLCNTPIWMDTRAREVCEEVKEKIGEDRIFSIAGNDFLPSYSTPKVLWFQKYRPEVYAHTRQFLQSNSYLVYKLTGKYSQDYSQGYGLHFFDIEKKEYHPELAKDMGIETDLFPEVFSCDAVVGGVTQSAANLTGLRQGTPVVAGGLDAACGTLGAGVYRNGQAQEQGGQAGGMSICTDRAIPHKKLILSPHVIPGCWLLQGGTVGGGGALKWFRRELGENLSFDELTKEAEHISPGADGVVFLPYMAGERSPIWNPDARGVFYGLSYDKGRGHMVRAVLEGVAYSLEHNLRTAAEAGVEAEVLNAMGGAANSVLWTGIKADVTGKTFQVPASDTATTLGAALLAGVGVGLYKDYEEAVSRCISITRVQKPDPENYEMYRHGMELYLELYDALKETFKKFA